MTALRKGEVCMNTNRKISSEEFENIYCDYYPLIYRTAFSILKNEYDAWDAVQNIYVKILTSANSVSDKSKMKSWIMSVTYNECRNMLKSKKRELSRNACSDDDIGEYDEFEEFADFSSNPMCIADDEEFKEEILTLIGCLPQNQQKVIFLYYYKQYSVDEIAVALNISSGTVKSRLNYARKNLKILINEYESQHKVRLHSGFVAMIFADMKRVKLSAVKYIAVGVSAAAVISGCAMGVSSVFERLDAADENVPLKYEYIAEVTETTSVTEITAASSTSVTEISDVQNIAENEVSTAVWNDARENTDYYGKFTEIYTPKNKESDIENISENVTSVVESVASETAPVNDYTVVSESPFTQSLQEFSEPFPPMDDYESVKRTELFDDGMPAVSEIREPSEDNIRNCDKLDEDNYGIR